ncbi:histidine phosphatase family protein [Bacillus sp. FJAT-28004]|uniref:histidine phosphatase family protein n=1 Tax=Bacillus sp. FJAT-28004 TaxID=1679165 RepID=UPI0006B67B0B|nr:histidine phosphatase family protein [Bacillus sp. FJAT-28004]
MKQLILIRHGEAEHLLSGLVGGWTDTKLTERGRQQAKCTGERLLERFANVSVNLCSSDLSRASETAEIIGSVLSKDPILYEELRELNNGLAANLSAEDAKKIRNPITEPVIDWVPYPQAESWMLMFVRLSAFMDKLINNNDDDVIILVSHGNAIISLIHYWLEFSTEMFKISFDIQPCSITSLRVNKWSEKTISKLNDTSHLENKGIATTDIYFS